MKFIKLLFLTLIATSLISCSKAEIVNEVEEKAPVIEEKQEQKIDLDISGLSDTLVYAQVQQIVWHPEQYYDKIIRMKGIVDIFIDKNTNKTYYTCLVNDATACCSLGIEFRFPDNKPLPNKYNNGHEIIIQGKFSSYKEGEKTYYELVDSIIVNK